MNKPIATTSESLFSEPGKILESRRQLLIPESLNSLVVRLFCGCLFMKLDWIFFHRK
jgi:hypothetical protein